MATADFRGARGSNAGDDFHQLWVVRHALELLVPDTDLRAITVEGLLPGDEAAAPADSWDGVDCGFYYGGEGLDAVDRIVVDQLKYSAADPGQSWTTARLTHGSNRKGNNSVIARLAAIFSGIKGAQPRVILEGRLKVRLISNQPMAAEVLDAVAGDPGTIAAQSRLRLQEASGLSQEDFRSFTSILDFSQCGGDSRSAMEQRIVLAISTWTEDDARAALDGLMRFVQRKMMPDAKREYITRQSILSLLGFSDPQSLFPCEPRFSWTPNLISREATQRVLTRMLQGDQRICLHGEAGCGKTTVLQELETLLPAGSCMVKYDCYGGGSYLDSDAFRHRSQDAFLQLSNDLARSLRIPYLLTRSKEANYPAAFKKRLSKAAELVEASSPSALLVIAIDAADNALTAAEARIPPERSFLQDVLTLGDLPQNVRLLMTTRTGRRADLHLPGSFAAEEVGGFSPRETAEFVRSRRPDAPDPWLSDFHYFSMGNPRVQQYALQYAETQSADALEFLRPSGKELAQVFQEQITRCLRKVGKESDLGLFCAGLVALPRPIPISILATVTDLAAPHIHDICSDLAPGIKMVDGAIGFADEDFEDFVRTRAERQLQPLRARIAEHLYAGYQTDPYAAAHVATALMAAGRRQDIMRLVERDVPARIVPDPILRREVQLQRLRIAMRVCRESGDNSAALRVLLRGADAQKTDEVIHRILIENPDLTATFGRQTSAAAILRNADDIERHGPILFHLLAADATDGKAVAVREGHRQTNAWLSRRNEEFDRQRRDHPHVRPQGWEIDDRDIAAEIEAVCRMHGVQEGMKRMRDWRPRSVAARVARILFQRWLVSGERSLLNQLLDPSGVSAPWDLFLLVPLALTGEEPDLARIERALESLLRRGLIRVADLEETRLGPNSAGEFFDTVVTGCEYVICNGGNAAAILPVLERILDGGWRRRDKLHGFQLLALDIGLRAYALLRNISGQQVTIDDFWIAPPDLTLDPKSKEGKRAHAADREKQEELERVLQPLIRLYDVRAQILTSRIPSAEIPTKLTQAISHFRGQDYRFSHSPDATRIRARVALSISYLSCDHSMDPDALFDQVLETLGPDSLSYGSEQLEPLNALALVPRLQPRVTAWMRARAQRVSSQRISAAEKIQDLLMLARALLPLSHRDAEQLFNDAVQLAGDIDIETMDQIRLLAVLAKAGIGGMGVDQRRTTACDAAVAVANAAVRLAGYDHFPWISAARTLALLDLPFSLAVVARWEDEHLVDRTELLPAILQTGLQRRELDPDHVAVLTPLLDEMSEELIAGALEDARQRGSVSTELIEYVARDELTRFGGGARKAVEDALHTALADKSPGYWMARLAEAEAFHAVQSAGSPGHALLPSGAVSGALPFSKEWEQPHITAPQALVNFLEIWSRSEKATSISTVFELLRNATSPDDQFAFLDSLAGATDSPHLTGHTVVQELIKCLTAWHGSASARRWRRDRLLPSILDHLPSFARWISLGEDDFRELVSLVDLPNGQICAGLLEAMERHAENFNAATIYALVGVISEYCTGQETANVLARLCSDLRDRVDAGDRETWVVDDIPVTVSGSLARFLFAMLSDLETGVRWRACHALRRIAKLGHTEILDQIVALYDRATEQSYRDPGAPFYLQSARLWLCMALDRIAAETPEAIVPHCLWLLSVATDSQFPHLLVRAFAKSAVEAMAINGVVRLNPAQQAALRRANVSPLRRVTKARTYSLDSAGSSESENDARRFCFNSMDTLPYWYAPARRVFANLGEREFLDVAEQWIVDRWHVESNPWRWADEPRSARIPEDRGAWATNDHGSLPKLERYHTYLEWHAMWCAMGELLQTHALRKTEPNDIDGFSEWLKRQCLTIRPLWLADLHGGKPLEARLWSQVLQDKAAWIDEVDDADFMAELEPANNPARLVIASDHDVRSREFRQSVVVHSALVAPDLAASLMRALQTVPSSWDYNMPSAEDGTEIDDGPYSLKGWLSYGEYGSGLDEEDPLRYGMRPPQRVPAPDTVRSFALQQAFDHRLKWVDDQGRATFVYDAWSDIRGDEQERYYRYEETVRATGWRLAVDRSALWAYLNRIGRDLVMKVEITRGSKGYDYYSIRDEESAAESRFERILLLRKNGTIEAAEKSVGTWAVSRP